MQKAEHIQLDFRSAEHLPILKNSSFRMIKSNLPLIRKKHLT